MHTRIAAAMVALAASSHAQSPIDAEHVSVALDSGWTLESAAVNDELVGFFAWIPEDQVTPGNVDLAWLEHVGGGAWAMYGWTTGDAANAVAAIEAELGDPTALDGVDTLAIDASEAPTDPCDPTIQPGGQGGTAMPNGITATDPAAPLMNAVADDDALAVATLDALARCARYIRCERSTRIVSDDDQRHPLPGSITTRIVTKHDRVPNWIINIDQFPPRCPDGSTDTMRLVLARLPHKHHYNHAMPNWRRLVQWYQCCGLRPMHLAVYRNRARDYSVCGLELRLYKLR